MPSYARVLVSRDKKSNAKTMKLLQNNIFFFDVDVVEDLMMIKKLIFPKE